MGVLSALFESRLKRTALALTLWALGLSFLDIGRYLNETLFVDPVAKVRTLAGTLPKLDPGLKIIVFDDGGIQRLGRQPTFPEWHRIARHLFALGYEKVFLHGFPNLSSDVESGPGVNAGLERHQSGQLIVGAARYHAKGNPRALAAAEVSKALLLAGDGSGFGKASHVLAPSKALFPLIDHIGHMNLLQDDSVPKAFALDSRHVLPHLSFWASDRLRVEDGALVTDFGKVPAPADGRLFADMMSPMEAAKHSIPASLFLDFRRKTVRDVLPPRYVKALAGGRIAVLIPDGYTGVTQFVDTPSGKVPSYLVTVAMIHGVLGNRFLYAPFPSWLLVLAAVPLILVLTELRSLTYSVALLLGTGIIGYVGSALALDRVGWILPGAPLLILALVGAGIRVVHHSTDLWRHQIATAKDLELGRLVQSQLISQHLEGRAGPWCYTIAYEPHGPMSGDWVQVYERPPDTQVGPLAVIAIGDVVGKGPSAALSTAVIASVWSRSTAAWRMGQFDAEGFIKDLSATLNRTFRGNQCSTLSLAVLDETGVTLLCCGAPQWLAVDPGAKARGVTTRPHDPLGVDEHFELTSFKTVEPEPGEVLMAYTDGVMDGTAARRRFAKSLKAAGMPEEDIFPYLLREARRAGADEVLPDDFTMIMIRRGPSVATLPQDGGEAA